MEKVIKKNINIRIQLIGIICGIKKYYIYYNNLNLTYLCY